MPSPLSVDAPDDVGAETADRYDWQALTAAVDCLASVAASPLAGNAIRDDICIVCEHHEDYIVCIGDSIQLVSAKHRDLSQGSWTYATIFSDGGVAHLFHRWIAFGEALTARLVTNAGLNSDAAKLRILCDHLRETPVGPLVELFWEQLISAANRLLSATPTTQIQDEWEISGVATDEFVGAARRFLSVLSFDCERPPRHILPSAAISMYVIPFLESLGRDRELAKVAWSELCNLFRQRMRGRIDPTIEGLVSAIHGIHTLTPDERLKLRLHERAIWTRDVIEVIDVVAELGITAVDPGRAIAPTRLALKLINAGCQDTTVHAAEMVAQRWRGRESALALSGVGIAPNLERVKARALLIASEVHESIAQTGAGDYGPEMWVRLRTELTATQLNDDTIVEDDDLALGIICDLASQCRVWLSPAFDIEQARSVFPDRLESS